MHISLLKVRTFIGCYLSFPPEFVVRRHSFSLALPNHARTAVGVAKATVGVVDRRVLRKATLFKLSWAFLVA